MTFRALVARAQARGRKPIERPASLTVIADACGISRQHLHSLMRGAQYPQAYTICKIAAGLGVSVRTVKKALQETSDEVEE